MANWTYIRNQEEGDSEREPKPIGRAKHESSICRSMGSPPGGGPIKGGQRPTAKPLRCVKFEMFEGRNLTKGASPLATQRVATTGESNCCDQVTVFSKTDKTGQAELELLQHCRT